MTSSPKSALSTAVEANEPQAASSDILYANLPLSELLQKPGVVELLLAAFAFILYVGTLAFGFVYDDRMIVIGNGALRSWSYVTHYFTTNAWAMADSHTSANYYRPVWLLWMRLNYVAFGLNPTGWHATSVLLYSTATVELYWLGKRFLKSMTAAAMAALLFAVHPVHIESVSWVSGSCDLLAVVGLLGATLAFLKALDKTRGDVAPDAKWMALSLVAGACALLSKEIAVMLPALLFMTTLGTRNDLSAKQIAKWTAPSAVLTVAYLVARWAVLKGLTHPTATESTWHMVLTWPSALALYMRQLVVPFWMSPYFDVHWVSKATMNDVYKPLLLCVAALAAVALAWRRSDEPRKLGAALAWILLPLAPALYLKVFSAAELVHDRYLYASTVGYSLLVAMAVMALIENIPTSSQKFAKVGMGAALAVLAVLTVSGEMYWATDLLLFTHAVELAPENDSAVVNLGVMYMEHNQLERGAQLLRIVVKRNPQSSFAAYNLARYDYQVHNDAEAEVLLTRALYMEPTQERWWVQFAGIEMRLGKTANAESAIRRALALNPNGEEFHAALGAVLLEKGDITGAQAEFVTELKVNPDSATAKAGMQRIAAQRRK